MVEINKILFPCDFSDSARKVIPYVLTHAQKFGAAIQLMHVVEDLSRWGAGLYIPHLPLSSYQKEALEGARRTMETFCSKHMAGCNNYQKIIVTGDPYLEILKAIEENSVDLVIMGTHGRKGLEHTILGSVAENVIRKSPAPVLVVNPYTLKG